jgi:trimeric autotransporter adhesin
MKSSGCAMSMLLVTLMLSSVVSAQQTTTQSTPAVPRLVNFSGKAADAQGQSISGIAGVTFAIYKDQYEGTPLWLETQNVTADNKGNYTAQLGATRPQGLPLDLFSSGEARWLGVRVNGGEEQQRVLLLSVPYALKAADAETVGGLPASAFVLAAPPVSMTSTPTPSATPTQASLQLQATGTTPVTTAGGTVNKLTKFDANADITNSQVFDNGTNVGVGNTAPAAKLDVTGTGIFRGALSLPATAAATSVAGKNSQPLNFTASSFSSSTLKAVNETFRWQAEPAGNNTATPLGKLNLLFGSGTATPGETGLSISNKGQITFASGQTFPSTVGTVKSVALSAPSSDFAVSGSPVTSSGTLGLNWNVAPTSASTANAIVKRDASGSFSAGAISAALGVTSLSPGIAVYGETSGGGGGADGVHGVAHGTGSGVTGLSDNSNGVGVWAQGPGYALYANGNTGQARNAGGLAKAMVFVQGFTNTVIASCFNSTLSGAAATTPPCGFGFDKTGVGDYIVDFGFQVDDRFFSMAQTPGDILWVCTDVMGNCDNPLTPNKAEVVSWGLVSSDFNDAPFYLIVY